jgi:hypothetical protein
MVALSIRIMQNDKLHQRQLRPIHGKPMALTLTSSRIKPRKARGCGVGESPDKTGKAPAAISNRAISASPIRSNCFSRWVSMPESEAHEMLAINRSPMLRATVVGSETNGAAASST